MTEDKPKIAKSDDTIKLGIDAHAKWYDVARQLDGAVPKMDFEALLRFVPNRRISPVNIRCGLDCSHRRKTNNDQ